MAALTNLSFDDWIEHAFGHEVRSHGNPWYFDLDAPWWDAPADVAVRYLTGLFSAPESALAGFSDAQIAQGLTYLVNTSASGDNGWLSSRDVPVTDRRRCIEEIYTLFATIFAPRCAPILGHIDEAGGNALNMVCYMFWDTFPTIALQNDPDGAELRGTAVTVMEKTLWLDSIACQESALHGLGHSYRDCPGTVIDTIDRFLAGHGALRPDLATYAQSARCGCVL